MRDHEAVKTIWLLYHPPMEKARTGHMGLLVTQKIDDRIQAIYYFSLYHALLPSSIRKMAWGERLSSSVPSVTVSSYETDLIMRGQSWVRMLDEHKKEDETVQSLIANLVTDPALKEKYFNRGVYQYAIRLPASMNADCVIAELERIKNSASWAIIGPITQGLFLDPTAYNCCSAIDSALQKGMTKPYQTGRQGEFIAIAKKTADFMYFMTLLFSPEMTVSRDNPAMALWFVPAVYCIMQALRDSMEFVFMNDLKLTPLGKLEGTKLYFLSAFFTMLNLITMPFSIRATDAFIYPTSLARKAERQYGGVLSHAGFEDLPRLELC